MVPELPKQKVSDLFYVSKCLNFDFDTSTIDDVVKLINDYKNKIKLLEDVKRMRIKEGEVTEGMKKRQTKNKSKKSSIEQTVDEVVQHIQSPSANKVMQQMNH